MRLGLRPTVFEPESENWSKVRKLYGGAGKIWERHPHRYEVNPEYIERLTAKGLSFVGKDEKGERMQVLELPGWSHYYCNASVLLYLTSVIADHPYFVGFQAHPEFCTRPLNPSPAFLGFVAAACGTTVLQEQIQVQLTSFHPPHPEGAMVSEETLRRAEPTPLGEEVLLNEES